MTCLAKFAKIKIVLSQIRKKYDEGVEYKRNRDRKVMA